MDAVASSGQISAQASPVFCVMTLMINTQMNKQSNVHQTDVLQERTNTRCVGVFREIMFSLTKQHAFALSFMFYRFNNFVCFRCALLWSHFRIRKGNLFDTQWSRVICQKYFLSFKKIGAYLAQSPRTFSYWHTFTIISTFCRYQKGQNENEICENVYLRITMKIKNWQDSLLTSEDCSTSSRWYDHWYYTREHYYCFWTSWGQMSVSPKGVSKVCTRCSRVMFASA